MKNPIMHDLYFGSLVPWERGRSHDPAYSAATQKISDIKEHFRALLSPDECKRFEQMENLEVDCSTIEEIELFEYGFCMASLIMMDVFAFKEARLTERETNQ